MFDIGFWEVIIVTLVALLVVGPERLPGLAREIGRFVGKTRRFVQSVRSDIEQELQTEELRKLLQGQEKEIQELKIMMRDTETSLREDLKDTEDSLRVDLHDDLTGPDRKPPGPKSAEPGASAEKSAPQIQRVVPVPRALDGDLLTDAPAPQPAERPESGQASEAEGGDLKADKA
jgi:sec-independent protein translocase protein TatB